MPLPTSRIVLVLTQHPGLLAWTLLNMLPLTGCNAALGLNDFSVQGQVTFAEEPFKCESNRECVKELSKAADGGEVPAYCDAASQQCKPLLSEDCTSATPGYLDDRAIFIGSLFSTQGAQAATNLQRQQSAMLAVEQVNSAGGIPSAKNGSPRPLVLVSCNETVDVVRAGEHLADIGVAAIIGPNTSQDTLNVSNEVTIPRGIAVLTPTGVASSIADLIDHDLTFQMVPTDVQRAPLMLQQIEAIAGDIAATREDAPVKVGIIFRNDALGVGTRTSLNSLTLNGKPLADSVNLGNNVEIDGYDFSKPDQQEIVDKYVEFAPDIIALAGTAEAITQVMIPLEAAWTAKHRPEYVLIDSVKVPELLTACTESADLRGRVRGTGIKPTVSSAPVYDAFKIDYLVNYPTETATTSGMGPSYDAAFSIALALAATKSEKPSGKSVAEGLRLLSGGSETIEIGGIHVLAAFQALGQGPIAALGTFAPLEWNADGTVVGSTLEMWCVGLGANDAAAYKSSGLTFDIRGQVASGEFTPCTPVAD